MRRMSARHRLLRTQPGVLRLVPAGLASDAGRMAAAPQEGQKPEAQAGPIGRRPHGSKAGDQWSSPPSLVQFRNISIAEQ
jgi:hypothetical protein